MDHRAEVIASSIYFRPFFTTYRLPSGRIVKKVHQNGGDYVRVYRASEYKYTDHWATTMNAILTMQSPDTGGLPDYFTVNKTVAWLHGLWQHYVEVPDGRYDEAAFWATRHGFGALEIRPQKQGDDNDN